MKARNVLHRAANILTTAILVVAVCFAMVAVSATLALGKGEASLLGWKPYIVLSDSMREDFQVGDLAFSHEVDPATLGPGDIVTFASIDPASYGDVVTHKIRKIVEHEGEPAFVTYGTTTGADDAYPVPFSRVTGSYVFSIPKAGYLFEFFRTPAGYVGLVLVPFAILIGLQVRTFVRLLRKDRDQRARVLEEELRQERKARAKLDMMRTLSRMAPIEVPVPPRGKHAAVATGPRATTPRAAASRTTRPRHAPASEPWLRGKHAKRPGAAA